MKQQQRNKIMSRFNKIPYTEIGVRGTQIIAENQEKHKITRNVLHFKKYNSYVDISEDIDSECEDVGVRNSNEVQNEQESQSNGSSRLSRSRRPPERYGNSIPSSLILFFWKFQ